MKRNVISSSGGTSSAFRKQLRLMLAENRASLENYREVLSSLDDDDYVARGNGFCESRYSTDFIESQIQKYEQHIREIESLLYGSHNDI